MSEKIIVTVNQGKIRGVKEKSTFSGTAYYSFFGIPYAQPPVGRLRFRDPVKVKPWKDVLDATREKDGFIQYSYAYYAFKGAEENLYVNVHTPKLPSKDEPLRPVIVLVHPGSFNFGSPDSWEFGSPNFLIHNDIVYVTMTYRLHILGFLNLELPECSGNQGLKDIILALRWIKDNIRSFNGDPDNITLIGSSSAAYAIHAFMLSPLLEDSGLFHKVVLMGMYMFSSPVVVSGENKTIAFEFARTLGFEGDDPKKLLEFLRKVPADDLASRNKEYRNQDQDLAPVYPIITFQPTDDYGENPVIPKHLRKRIDSTMKIPIMFGLCENEAVMGFTTKLARSTEKNFRKSYRQNTKGWMHNLSDHELTAINERIDSFYLKNCPKDDIPVSVKVDILTDATYSEVYDSLIDVVAAQLPQSVYVYKFEFEGSLLTMKQLLPWDKGEKLKGTYHGSDFCHWAYTTEPRDKETVEMIRKFTKLICTFARQGDPNYNGVEQRWTPTTPQQPCYMRVNQRLEMVEGKLYGERTAFWDRLLKEFKKD